MTRYSFCLNATRWNLSLKYVVVYFHSNVIEGDYYNDKKSQIIIFHE